MGRARDIDDPRPGPVIGPENVLWIHRERRGAGSGRGPGRAEDGDQSMRRTIALGLLTTTLGGCLPPGLDGAAAPTQPIGSMVPDPAYRPQVGDRSVLYGVAGDAPLEQLPLLQDITAFEML